MRHWEKNCAALFIILCFAVHGIGQDILTVGEVSAKPGEKVSGFIRVPAGNDGPEIRIPVTLIRSRNPGPVLALMAGIHGCEYVPIIALQRLNRELEPEALSGSVILVLVAHMQSFLKRTEYYNPVDWHNLNRMFPGTPDGTMSQRIAYQITTQVIDKCDVLIDNHGGDANEDLAPFIFCTETGNPGIDKRMQAIAEVYGIQFIHKEKTSLNDPPQLASTTAAVRGKPAITIESGKLGITNEKDITRVIRGSFNVMKHLKMVNGKPDKTVNPLWIKEYISIRSEHEGIYYPLVQSEEKVKKGQLLGKVTDFFGQTLQEARAPFDGMMMYIIATPPISTGEVLGAVVRF
jgi:predicted deacylase